MQYEATIRPGISLVWGLLAKGRRYAAADRLVGEVERVISVQALLQIVALS
jgi:hypothetical protein